MIDAHRLEECPDLEGIETLVSCVSFRYLHVRLEECPDLEGIETYRFVFYILPDFLVWSSAPT